MFMIKMMNAACFLAMKEEEEGRIKYYKIQTRKSKNDNFFFKNWYKDYNADSPRVLL